MLTLGPLNEVARIRHGFFSRNGVQQGPFRLEQGHLHRGGG